MKMALSGKLENAQKVRQRHSAQKLNHSARAVANFCLNDCLFFKCLS